MKGRPNIYDVIILGGPVASQGTPTARVGGFWMQPNIALSYLLAARHVIEGGVRDSRLNEIALPAAYLQRHAFEVALKDVIGLARSIQADEEWLAALKANVHAPRPQELNVPQKHGFAALLSAMASALAAIKYDSPSAEVVEMVKRLDGLEQTEPTRLRYRNLRDGRPSLPDAVQLAIGETQDQLELLFEEAFIFRSADGIDDNLFTSLAWESEALSQHIHAIIPPELA